MSFNVSLENGWAADDTGLALGALVSVPLAGALDPWEVVDLGRRHLIVVEGVVRKDLWVVSRGESYARA